MPDGTSRGSAVLKLTYFPRKCGSASSGTQVCGRVQCSDEKNLSFSAFALFSIHSGRWRGGNGDGTASCLGLDAFALLYLGFRLEEEHHVPDLVLQVPDLVRKILFFLVRELRLFFELCEVAHQALRHSALISELLLQFAGELSHLVPRGVLP